jgi:hypothetical protein
VDIIASGIAAPQCGNYDDALVAAKTRAALGCGDPGMMEIAIYFSEKLILFLFRSYNEE